MSINCVIASGNLTREPEYRATNSGSSVLTFGLAVNDRVRNGQTGEWEDYANFIDCVLFGNRAESLAKILRKGMRVVIKGRLHYSSWENKEGNKRSKVEVIVDDVDLPPRSQTQQGYSANQPPQQQPRYQQQAPQQQVPQHQQPPQQQYAPQTQQQYAQQQQQQGGYYDDDIPF